ncbi:MAG: hypothetical protein WBG50_03180, partial [Desulfomonilaceae bacterium]
MPAYADDQTGPRIEVRGDEWQAGCPPHLILAGIVTCLLAHSYENPPTIGRQGGDRLVGEARALGLAVSLGKA